MEALFKTVGDYAYIHTGLGSDIFGDGSITKPFVSYLKANTVFPSKKKLLLGILIENIVSILNILGDSKWQSIISQTSAIANYGQPIIENIKYSGVINAFGFSNSIVKTISGVLSYSNNSIINSSNNSLVWHTGVKFTNCTIIEFTNVTKSENSIFIKNRYIDTTGDRNCRNCIFPSTCLFYINNALVTGYNFGNDSVENVRILKRAIDTAWAEFGENTILDDALGTININGQKIETCRIIKEQKDGGVLPNIFNSYESDGVTPSDYYLNADPNNVALYASDMGDYVGALAPAKKSVGVNQYLNVDPSTGASSAQAGNIFFLDETSGVLINAEPEDYAGQTWNRCTTGVIELTKHASFSAACNFGFSSAKTSGLYIGKRQNLFGAVLSPAGASFTVEAGKRYKVYDVSDRLDSESGMLISQSGQADIAITRGNIFLTPDTIVSVYTARSETGVTIREVINDPRESLEVLPYDSATTPSAFPPFSSPINDPVLMLYHLTGDNIGQPVLFSEITHDKPSYYDSYAITNADKEYADLIADTANYEAKSVSLRYCRIETNVHYEESLAV
ncbi:MAG: hypothetical protein LBN93_10630 [Candidatus Symbiothrix sp.]|jgi:hypothetical protein|nr:hypothetical protein [Candidatus Symbiothrix sp.]